MAQTFSQHNPQAPLPWKKMLLVVLVLFITGLLYITQEFAGFFSGSIVGQPKYLLSGYNCPSSSTSFDVSPLPDLFSYQKGNTEFNRREMLRINKKNQGITAWYSYDKGFDESGKAALINLLSSESNENQYISRLYSAIKSDKSPHGSVDFVTKWLAPDNINMPTVYPYTSGLVVDAVSGSSGYGNYVSVCTDIVSSSGKKLRLLYNVAHLDSLAVAEGDLVSAGTKLGNIGTTGSSSTPHAHISIMPDLVWDTNYKTIYNAGYKFYYSNNVPETLVKTIDPVAVMLNPQMAYSIVQNDEHRKGIFSNAGSYVAGLSGAVALGGDGVILNNSTASVIEAPRLNDFRLTLDSSEKKVNDLVKVTVEALDQKGDLYTGFNSDLNVVLSTDTARFDSIGSMSSGKTSFQVTDSVPGEVLIQVSDQVAISEEVKVVFIDTLQFLEVTAPQKTTVGKSVAVVVRPVGKLGDVISAALPVAVSVFPQTTSSPSTQSLNIQDGRGEYQFKTAQEGIYQLTFASDGVEEKVQILVEDPNKNDDKDNNEDTEVVIEETKPVVEEVKPAAEETVQEEAKSLDEEPVEEEVKPVVDETAVTVNDPQINLLEDPKYRIYDIFDDKVIVFDDQKVDSDFPVEMRFTVPEGTDAVSIFTGYNTRNFPDTGELKLTKYTPGQEVVRYYPKYVAEDTYKKIVAYRNGQVYAEQVFTWSPMSLHVFLDVIDGVTDKEVYNAVVALKEAGVFKGNPDGTFGVDTPINRAGVATVLIRALYSDIDLETVKIGSNPFPDVKPDKWYANAMYVASGGAFEGSSLPAFIKGRPDGSADPDGNVKVEEFVTMVLRALEIPFDTTDPWYEGPISRAIAIGLISEEERSLIDQPLARGIVARIMVKALDLVEHLDELKALYPAAEVKDDHDITDIKDDKDLESSGVSSNNHSEVQAVAAFDLTSLYSGNGMGLTISWQSDFEGPFKVYRQKVDSDEEIYLGGSRGTAFRDTSVEKGQQYYYRVGLDGIEAETTEKVEILVEL